MPWGCSHRAPTDGTPRMSCSMSPTLPRLDPAALPVFGQASLGPGEVSVPWGAAGGHLQAACAGLAGIISGRLRSIAHTNSTGQEPPRCSQRWGGAAEHVSAAGTGTRSCASAKKGTKPGKKQPFTSPSPSDTKSHCPTPCLDPTHLYGNTHGTEQPKHPRLPGVPQSNPGPRGCDRSRQHHGDLGFCVCHEMWQPQCSSGHGAQHPRPPQGRLALPVSSGTAHGEGRRAPRGNYSPERRSCERIQRRNPG